MLGRGALLAALACLAWPAPAGAGFQVGLQDDSQFLSSIPWVRERALNHAETLGVTYIRMTMVWEGYRSQGLQPYDDAVDDALARGMTVQLTVTGNPAFTLYGLGDIGYRWPSPSRYARWLGRVARHFRGRVALYSLWNEPNLAAYLWPQRLGHRELGPWLYGRLAAAGYRAVKRADPKARVLVGEAAPSNHPVRFMERAARSVPGGLVADGWAHHPYQFVDVWPGVPQGRYSGGICSRPVYSTDSRIRWNVQFGLRPDHHHSRYRYESPGGHVPNELCQ